MAAKVEPEDREKHSATGDKNSEGKGRFPVASRSQAISALKLRGHAGSKEKRRAIIRAAAKYVPAAAAAALKADKASGAL